MSNRPHRHEERSVVRIDVVANRLQRDHVYQSPSWVNRLQGELPLRVGADDVRLGAGVTILAPKGVPHTDRVESPDGACWCVITTCGDFERFVWSMSVQPRPPGSPSRPDRPRLS